MDLGVEHIERNGAIAYDFIMKREQIDFAPSSCFASSPSLRISI
jgi:hypothetical protein